jgi:hypothetical protein
MKKATYLDKDERELAGSIKNEEWVSEREIVALKKFKNLMAKQAGKLTFEALGE